MEDKILLKVRKMLDLANHANTGAAEREAFLAKADEMMVKHAIDAAMLDATLNINQRRAPVVETVPMWDKHSVHAQRFSTVLREVCKTVRVRCNEKYEWDTTDQNVTLVGFNDDVQYAQLLFTNIQFAFIGAVKPTWDMARGFDANVAACRESGMAWEEIARAGMRAGDPEARWPDGGTLGRAVARDCKKRGVPIPKVTRHAAYANTFSEAFVTRICARLEELRDAGEEQAKGSGAELVLVHAAEQVDDAFFELFPNLRPKTEEELKAARDAWKAKQQLEREKHDAWWATLTPAQQAAEERKIQAQHEKDSRESDKYWRRYDKLNAARYDSAGDRAGARAADAVRLDRPGPATEARQSAAIS